MCESSPLDEPLLSRDRTLWVLISLGWLVIGALAVLSGRELFGAAWLLLGIASVYRVYRPG